MSLEASTTGWRGDYSEFRDEEVRIISALQSADTFPRDIPLCPPDGTRFRTMISS